MVVLPAEEMRKIDEVCINHFKIPGIVLMENAARSIYEVIATEIKRFKERHYYILCYRGNNSGDGFALARHLYNHGCEVTVLLFCDADRIQGDALVNYQIIMKIGQIEIIHKPFVNELEIEKDAVIVDALLGIGFSGSLSGILLEAVDFFNQLKEQKKIAVDIPTGLIADTGQAEGEVFQADITVTMGYIKPGLLLFPGADYCGRIYVADISAIPEALSFIKSSMFTNQSSNIQLPKRFTNSHKGSYGKVSIIAGFGHMTGAGLLASISVLKSGAGMAKWHSFAKDASVLTNPEIMLEKYISDQEFIESYPEIETWTNTFVIGPGIGVGEMQHNVLSFLLDTWKDKLVIDADGLNNLNCSMLMTRENQLTVLTPHPREFCRLIGQPLDDILEDPIHFLRSFCEEYQINVVLKTVPVLICDYRGNIYFNYSGNNSLATAGSGDILTGILAGFMSQGLDFFEAVRSAVYIHGLCGSLASETLTNYAVTATNILDYLPEAIKKVNKEKNQYDHSCS